MHYFWTTDLHLNRFFFKKKQKFISKIWENADGLIISGDVSSSNNLITDLLLLGEEGKPVYFVCGNHEWTSTSFSVMRESFKALPHNIIYLTQSEPIYLSETTALIGDDGWYDSRYCEPLTNFVFFFDWYLINDFKNKNQTQKIALCRELAWESTRRIVKKVLKAIKTHKEIIIISHFPPFRQKHKYDLFGKFWIPYNTNKYLGECLQIIAESNPDVKFTVRAGHSHMKEHIQVLDNLECFVGEARELISINI